MTSLREVSSKRWMALGREKGGVVQEMSATHRREAGKQWRAPTVILVALVAAVEVITVYQVRRVRSQCFIIGEDDPAAAERGAGERHRKRQAACQRPACDIMGSVDYYDALRCNSAQVHTAALPSPARQCPAPALRQSSMPRLPRLRCCILALPQPEHRVGGARGTRSGGVFMHKGHKCAPQDQQPWRMRSWGAEGHRAGKTRGEPTNAAKHTHAALNRYKNHI